MLYQDSTGHFWETALDLASLAWSAYDFIKKPSLMNRAFLVWDFCATFLLCIPGSYVGKAFKGLGKGASKISQAFKQSSKITFAISQTAKAVKTADKIHDSTQALMNR